MQRLASLAFVVATAGGLSAQAPASIDWSALDAETLKHFQALVQEGEADLGIREMAEGHFPNIEAEFCLAEGGNLNRQGGEVTFASIQTLEKIPRAIELTARGTAGHASVPLRTNAVVKLSGAVSTVAEWKSELYRFVRFHCDLVADLARAR